METRIEQLEENMEIIQHDVDLLKQSQHDLNRDFEQLVKEVKESNLRFDESNKYLREQNNNILQAVISRNDKADKREHELKKLTKINFWKLLMAVTGASGIIALLIELLLNSHK